MTTKEYLSQISRLDRMIKNKLTELSQLKEMTHGLSAIPNEERVQSTPNFDKIGTAYCKIESMEENIDRLIDEYADKKMKSFHGLTEWKMRYCMIFCFLGI